MIALRVAASLFLFTLLAWGGSTPLYSSSLARPQQDESLAPARAVDLDDGGSNHGGTMKLYAAPQKISEAIGSFPFSNAKSITNKGGHAGPNSYGLQMNSQVFPTTVCSGCRGWVQFVFSNYGPGKTSHLGIEDFLYGVGTSCPAGLGWQYGRNKSGKGYCTQSHRAANVPNVPISQLGQMVMTAEVAAGGDSLFLRVGKKMYGMRNVQSDELTDLREHWQIVEFDVFGDCCSSETQFGPNTTVTVRVEANTGLPAAPTCKQYASTTAESNNLTYVTPAGHYAAVKYPSVVFSETNLPTTGKALCLPFPAE